MLLTCFSVQSDSCVRDCPLSDAMIGLFHGEADHLLKEINLNGHAPELTRLLRR